MSVSPDRSARRSARALLGFVLVLVTAFAILAAAAPRVAHAEQGRVVLWHSYRGREEDALKQLVRRFTAEHPAIQVELIAVPNEGMAAKLTTAIPRGHGPDLFIFGHDRIGGWANAELVTSLDDEDTSAYLPETTAALRFEGHLWGWPLAFKSLVLYYNRALVPTPPATTDALLALAPALRARGVVPLAYEAEKLYHHAGWLHGFGGVLLRDDGSLGFDEPGTIASLGFAAELLRAKVIPEELSGALVGSLFNDSRAAMVLSGPWFLGELAPGVDAAVAPMPIVSATGQPARPFLSVEALFLSARAQDPASARLLARFLSADEPAAVTRALVGRQPVATRAAWDDARVSGDAMLAGFRAQLPATVAMDARPAMQAVWEPGDLALKKALRGGEPPADAARAAMRRFASITRPQPPAAAPWPFLALAALAGVFALVQLGRWFAGVARRGEGRAARVGARWVAPAMVATVVLVIVPFSVGLVLSLFSHHEGDWRFVGLANFIDILSAKGTGFFEPLSFYYALVVTIVWTAVNVALHVALGVGLALLLDQKGLRLRALYRVLLVIPWAIPNYITALIWKTLFHKQYGAINSLLGAMGLDQVSWFSSFGTAFFANVCANAWLGFPFMMVVALGALQAIPRDLYEAADVDGASRWAQFRHITLPLLGPAMLPAVMLGIIWTFNQFNVIYLVSGGEPDNATDILISEAFRWAFARQEQYGYAAAYATLIFVLLLGWSLVSSRAARKNAEAAR